MITEMCACGRPLHYSDEATKLLVMKLIAHQGQLITVHTSRGGWLVPRHYIALHGLNASELPELAKTLGFQEVKR